MNREKAIDLLDNLIGMVEDNQESDYDTALKMGKQALSQVSEIEENITKYMKKYPNHVGNTDFWEGFYACRNVVLQLDDEEYSPKEQEPCDDAISREFVELVVEYPPADLCAYSEYKGKPYYSIKYYENGEEFIGYGTYKPEVLSRYLKEYFISSVTQKSGKWVRYKDNCLYNQCSYCGASHCREDDFCPNCGAKMESEEKE